MLARYDVSELQGAGGGLPTGTVTFVLADMVSSTRLWEEHGPAMPAILARLDQIVDDAVGAHNGARPVEQGEGDSFVAAFARAIDAAGFAVEVQRALGRAEPPEGIEVRLRMALHTGDARLRDDGRYMGEALNRCARVRQLAHGGQVLVSGTTADLVVEQLSDGVFLRELGVHHLRDLSRPERVAQLSGPGLAFDFPPLRSLDRFPHNLPPQLTSFFGRGTELAETAALLAERRMVALTGAGGCGKTRLAVQLGADVLDHYPDGVWLTDLGPVAEPGLVAEAVAAALGLSEVPGEPMLDTVGGHLRDRVALLIVDNCEHLIDASAETIEQLLVRCPGVRALATSREPLGVTGETTYRVPTLPLPADDADTGCASMQLFIDRAALARPRLVIEPGTAAASAAAICRRLDGIPLAIELAAARCRTLTPDQIAAQLEDRLGLLAGGRRAVLPRHRTLEASVDWSYSLLDDDERAVLRRLSVFTGGFTLEATEVVCADDALDRWRVVDLVSGLVDKSLVQEEEPPRYRLLETIRQFARQKLIEAGEAATVHQRHAEHFVALADAAGPGLLGPDGARWRRRLLSELDNLRAADDWAADTGQADLALRLGVRELWHHGHPSEGRRRLMRALDSPEGTPRLRGRAMLAAAECAWSTGDFGAMASLGREGLRIADELDDRNLKGELLSIIGWAEFPQGNEAARRLLDEALGLLQPDGPPYWIVDTHFGLGLIGIYAGEPEAARHHLTEGVSLGRATGNPAVGRTLVTLAAELMLEGDFDASEALLAEARPQLAESADLILEQVDSCRAWIRGARGDWAGALALADGALAQARRLEQAYTIAWALWSRLLAEYRGGEPGNSLPSLDEAEAAMATEGMSWAVASCRAIRAEHLLAAGDPAGARGAAEAAVALADSTMYAGRARGRARLALARVMRAEGDPGGAEHVAHQALAAMASAGARPEVIEALELLGGLAAEQASAAEAARLFAAASAGRSGLDYPVPPVEVAGLDSDLAGVRARLDPAAFDAAWSEGAAMSLDDAVAYGSRGRGERKRPASGWSSLTPTEREVVRLVSEGLRNAEVAAKLFVSVATVKTHLIHVFAKLGVSTRAELAALAARRG